MGYLRHPNTSCLVCKETVYRRRGQLAISEGRAFCGMVCYGKYLRKETPCVICGKLIMAHFNKKTCSRACSNINRAGIKYNHNRSKDKVVHERSLKLRLLKLRGTKCERCGYATPQILHVHHRDRNHQNNNYDNLELICPNCHYEEHFLEKSWLNDYNLAH